MARIHEEAESCSTEHDFMAPTPLLTRVLNYLPGYGSTPIRSPKQWSPLAAHQRPSSRKTIGIAMVLLAGCFATGYGFEQVQHVVKKAEAARAQVLDRVRHTKAYAEKFAEIESSRIAEMAAAEAPSTSNLGSPTASVITEPDELSIRGIAPVRETQRMAARDEASHMASMTAPKEESQAATVDLSTLEGALFFMSDHSGQHFSLRPVNDVTSGKASIYWNPARRQALLTIRDLKATADDQRYSLRYVLDDGTTEEVYHFTEPLAELEHQVTLEHAPGHHVIGAQLFLETATANGQPQRETVLSAATRLQNK